MTTYYYKEWKNGDYFTFRDWNRIQTNAKYLASQGQTTYDSTVLALEDVGKEDIFDYSAYTSISSMMLKLREVTGVTLKSILEIYYPSHPQFPRYTYINNYEYDLKVLLEYYGQTVEQIDSYGTWSATSTDTWDNIKPDLWGFLYE